ncbi:MAG: hypothetical protein M3417_06865, partial [Actinomycetota bacterium]|nr:hypothetical protein [Actinomycetota bacterium]
MPRERLLAGVALLVAHALALDALSRPGPAVPANLDRATVCSRPYHPGINTAHGGQRRKRRARQLPDLQAAGAHRQARPALLRHRDLRHARRGPEASRARLRLTPALH